MKKYFILFLFVFIASFLKGQVFPEWKLTGPTLFPVNISGQINGIGRMTQLKFHPQNDQIIYATAASGGLWKSLDEGKNWKVLGTDFLPKLNCASVCIDYSNDSILYLGTGDPNYYFNSLGVYKSLDGGETWMSKNSGMGNLMALEIVMDPKDHNVLIAATSNGIYRTINGGDLWTKVQNSGNFTAMEANPQSGSRILYACTMSDFYRSKDFGETWNIVSNGLVSGDNRGCRIAVSKSNPAIVYLGMVKNEGMIFQSADSGLTFTLKRNKASESILGYDAVSPGQGNYNFGITVDPLNANIVYTASHCVWRSLDGGVNFSKLTDWPRILHTDMHQILFSPYFPQKLYNVNDGGIFISNSNNRSDWEPLSNNLATTECYHASTSPIRYDMTSIGTQDNGGLTFVDNTWKTNRGGDWSSLEEYDYSNENQVYYLSNGTRRSTTDGGLSQEKSFNAPFTLNNTNRMVFSPYKNDLAFLSESNVWRTVNLNNGEVTWTKILSNNSSVSYLYLSPNNPNRLFIILGNRKILVTNSAIDEKPVYDTLLAPASTGVSASIVELKGKPNELIISCGTKVFKSTDSGKTWLDYSTGLPSINFIKVKQDIFSLDNTLYIGCAKGVYTRNVKKSNWELYTNNLPSIADITEFMDFNDGTKQSVLRVAFYGRGVWEVPYSRNDSLKADFSSLKKTCIDNPIVFLNNSLGEPKVFKWQFPGGLPATSTEKNPEITYSKEGFYDVQLIVQKETKSDTLICKNCVEVLIPNRPTLSRVKDTIYTSPAGSYQWLKNGYNIQNANLRYYIPKTAGTYSVLTNDVNFCINESNGIEYPFTVGITENSSIMNLEIFPNPIQDKLNYSFNSKLPTQIELEIIDINGKSFWRKSSYVNVGKNAQSLSVKGLSAGNYLLKISIGKEIITEKFIVE